MITLTNYCSLHLRTSEQGDLYQWLEQRGKQLSSLYGIWWHAQPCLIISEILTSKDLFTYDQDFSFPLEV